MLTEFLLIENWALPRAAFERLVEEARTSVTRGLGEAASLSRARSPSRTDATGHDHAHAPRGQSDLNDFHSLQDLAPLPKRGAPIPCVPRAAGITQSNAE